MSVCQIASKQFKNWPGDFLCVLFTNEITKNHTTVFNIIITFQKNDKLLKNEIIFTLIHKTKIYSIKQNIQNSKFSEVFKLFRTTLLFSLIKQYNRQNEYSTVIITIIYRLHWSLFWLQR